MVNRANINPAMMLWARQYAGFTEGYENDLPNEIKEKYEKWEKGETAPTWNQLRNVSKKFNVPTAYFFMKKPPSFDNLPDLINYRRLDANSQYKTNSPSLIENIRKSEIRRSIFINLLKELNENVVKFDSPHLPHNKKAYSKYIRDKLGVSLDMQKSWIKNNNTNDFKHYTFLNNWKEVITEKLGILIFETKDVSINEMRGLCVLHQNVPIILLNGKDGPNGRIFTLFHELTHLLMGESAICGDDMDRDIEIFCNSVAGEFLVPEDDLMNNINRKHGLYHESLRDVSNLYGVSEHVILRRLLDTNTIDKNLYTKYINEFNELVMSNPGKSGGYYLNNMIKYNGKPFYSVVLTAYDMGIISSLEVARFTNLGQKQIPILQKKLFGG